MIFAILILVTGTVVGVKFVSLVSATVVRKDFDAPWKKHAGEMYVVSFIDSALAMKRSI